MQFYPLKSLILSMQAIRTAILSYGLSGRVFHAPFIHIHSGFELVACTERSRKQVTQRYPGVKSYDTVEEIFNDPHIELVVVNTPIYTHYEYAKKALEAGKHLIVEKAFTSTLAEAEELRDLARIHNRKLAVFQNRRWDSDFKTIKKVLDKGLLGGIKEVEIHFDRYRPELSPKPHKEEANAGSGVLKDLGPHIIDQALYLYGMPDAVFADIQTYRPGSVVDDYFDILLYYPTFRARLKSSYFVREPIPSYAIHGTLGSLLKPMTNIQEVQLDGGMMPNEEGYGIEPESARALLHTEIDGKVVREHIPTEPGNYMDFYEGVYQAIRNNHVEPVTATEGVNVMRVIEAAIDSSKQQRAIRL